MNKPDFIIAGAAKSGTTSLAQHLNQSKEISCILTLDGSELHFFSKNFHKGHKWYTNLFSDLPSSTLLGEKSVSYLESKYAATRIKSFVPYIKLIFMLRNPIDRAYSQYKSNAQRGKEIFSFETAIKLEKIRNKYFKNISTI